MRRAAPRVRASGPVLFRTSGRTAHARGNWLWKVLCAGNVYIYDAEKPDQLMTVLSAGPDPVTLLAFQVNEALRDSAGGVLFPLLMPSVQCQSHGTANSRPRAGRLSPGQVSRGKARASHRAQRLRQPHWHRRQKLLHQHQSYQQRRRLRLPRRRIRSRSRRASRRSIWSWNCRRWIRRICRRRPDQQAAALRAGAPAPWRRTQRS